MVSPWTIVASDFVKTGGMDIANLALAEHLANKGDIDVRLQLVTHRVDASWKTQSNVSIMSVPRPWGMNLLGEIFLARVGRRASKTGGTVVVNGGNCCVEGSVNWVHYVHAAYRPKVATGLLRRIKGYVHRSRSLRDEKRSLDASRLVICNSQLTANHCHELLHIPQKKIVTLYYGIDPTQFCPPNPSEKHHARLSLGWHDDSLRLLFVGALADERKGFDTLFESWRLLQDCLRQESFLGVPRSRLVVVGSGAALPRWIRLAAESGLENSIDFLGFRKDVPLLMKAADALISPTRYEAYGLGVHEAICCGLPAFVSRKSGVAERYPRELDSLLIDDPDDPSALAKQLLHWLGHRQSYTKAVAEFSRNLRSRSWEDMAAEFVETCQSDCDRLTSEWKY